MVGCRLDTGVLDKWIDLPSASFDQVQFISQCQEKGRRAEILTIKYAQSGDACRLLLFISSKECQFPPDPPCFSKMVFCMPCLSLNS